MPRDSISAPSSSAGIVRFSDVTSSNILLSPKLVLAIAVVFIIAELVLGLVFSGA